MNKLLKKATTAVTTGALIATSFAPATFADTTIEIAGNGSKSNNHISIDFQKAFRVHQSNNTDISNNVFVAANTGANNASGNTNGDVSISTGNATTEVAIRNEGSHNILDLGNCSCEEGDLDIVIAGNGYRSDNRISVQKNEDNEIKQDNNTNIENNVGVLVNTGDNNVGGHSEGNKYSHDFNKKDHEHKEKEYNYDKKVSYDHEKKHDDKKFSYKKGGDGYNYNYQKSRYNFDHDKSKNFSRTKHNRFNGWNNHKLGWYHDWLKDRYDNKNSGGDVSIETGNVDTIVSILNHGSHNEIR